MGKFTIFNGKTKWKTMEKTTFVMGKLTISMAIFHSYVSHYQRDPEGIYDYDALGFLD